MSHVRKGLIELIDDALSDNPRAALVAAHQLEDEVKWLQHKAVTLARVNGYGWGRIGRLLGMSRQGAAKRFHLAPPVASPSTLRAARERRREHEAERIRRILTDRQQPEPDDPVFW